jgi:hypothetical protein
MTLRLAPFCDGQGIATGAGGTQRSPQAHHMAFTAVQDYREVQALALQGLTFRTENRAMMRPGAECRLWSPEDPNFALRFDPEWKRPQDD